VSSPNKNAKSDTGFVHTGYAKC